MDQFITWDMVGTVAGAAAVVSLLIAFTKDLWDKVGSANNIHIRTKLVAYVYAEILLFGWAAYIGSLAPQQSILIMVNGIVVANLALGGYETLIK